MKEDGWQRSVEFFSTKPRRIHFTAEKNEGKKNQVGSTKNVASTSIAPMKKEKKTPRKIKEARKERPACSTDGIGSKRSYVNYP